MSLASSEPKSVLIFGGNGFMGAETSKVLIERGHRLTLVSRGSWPWDTSKTVKPFVRHFTCDRLSNSQCDKLKEQLGDEKFDVVLDFSAYKAGAVRPFYTFLADRVTHFYLYISSDSVYEVCNLAPGPSEETDAVRPESLADQQRLNRLDPYGDKKLEVEEYIHRKHSAVCNLAPGPSEETDAVRPESLADQQRLNRLDSYGDKKLEVEEYIHRKHAAGPGMPNFIFLRLPDVLGPRDSTTRFWRYQLWLKLAHRLGIRVPVPKPIQKLSLNLINFSIYIFRTSYVYAKDVASLITRLVDTPPSPDLLNQAYNLGFAEDPKTLNDLLTDIALAAGVAESEEDAQRLIAATDTTDGDFFFPSVTRGSVNISKAVRRLEWQPTPWHTAIAETAAFYNDAESSYRSQLEETLSELLGELQPQLTDVQRLETQKFMVELGQRMDSRTREADEL